MTLMSACLGRNYNFGCINVFFGESARTAAKSRTNLSTNSAKATKQLGQLAPNLAHMCKFIWEWIWQTNCPSRHKGGGGHVRGFKGLTIQKSGKVSDWHQLWFTFADSSGNGHRLNTSRPSIPQGAFRGARGGGGVRVSQIQKSVEAVKRLDRLAPNLAHICRSVWEWICTPNKLPLETQGGHLGGLGIKHSKVLGSCQTAGPIGTNFSSRLWIHLGMEIG